MIVVEIKDEGIVKGLRRLSHGMANAAPLMASIAGIMHDSTMENFAQGGRPEWLGLLPSTLAAKKKSGYSVSPLIRTGRLQNSIVQQSDATTAIVGTNVKYAAIHQLGGQTAPHVILPKTKKALAFGGRVVKKVNHPGSKIPARPFFRLTPNDEAKIISKTSEYLASLIGPSQA